MPNRILREGIISSPRVDRLSPMAEIMYRRLMSVADDYGRYYGAPRMVRAACWPFHPNPPSEAEIEGLLAECAQPDSRLLAIYQHKNQAFLEILDFRQQTRSKSKFPEHDISPLATCEKPATQLLSTTRARTSPTNDKRQTHPNARDAAPRTDRFAEFSAPWPRIKNPGHALQAWMSAVDSEADEEAAFAARDRYMASDEFARGIYTDLATWIVDQKTADWAGKWPTARQPERKLTVMEQALQIEREEMKKNGR